MELSIKKINKAMEGFIDKENYKYAPSKYSFDYISDKDYVYMVVEMHYIIRVSRKDMPQILLAGHSMIKTELPAERMITTVVENKDATDFYMTDCVTDKGLELVSFTDNNGHTLWVNKKFFKQFFNHNIVDNGVPDNITFTAIGNKECYKSPLVMWENDEAVALFLPVIKK